MKNESGIYKIAFYGQSGAGKTCFLAALGLGAIGHPGKLSIERIPVGPEDLDDEARIKGQRLIDEAIRALENGDVPEPTPAIFEEPAPAVEFSIGIPERGNSRVQLIDYSGELINPSDQEDGDSLVNKLREHFRSGKYDAFVWLLQSPKQGKIDDQYVRNLRELREAFKSLNSEELNTHCALALGLTKWDRISTIDYENVENETEKLKEFCAKSIGLPEVISSGANVVDQQEPLHSALEYPPSGESAMYVERNFPIFAISAFGQARYEGNRELPPPISRMRSYGILDVIAWVINRRDELDVSEIKSLAPHGKIKKEERARYQDLMATATARIPKSVPHARVLKKIKGEVNRKKWKSLTGKIAGFIAILWCGNFFLGPATWAINAADEHINDPSTTEEMFRKDIARLEACRTGVKAVSTTLAFKIGVVISKIDEVKTRMEQNEWDNVSAIVDVIEKGRRAEKFLTKYPNSTHQVEAHRFVRAGKEKEIVIIAKRLISKTNDLSRYNLNELNELKTEVSTLLRENYLPTEYREQLSRIEAQLNSEIFARSKKLDFQEFKSQVVGKLGRNELYAALELLARREPKDKEWKDYGSTIVKEFEKHLNNAVAAERSSAGKIKVLEDVGNTLKSRESELRELGNVVGLLQVVNQQIQEEREQWDRELYGGVRRYRDVKACEKYLENAPLQKMKVVVEEYKRWLERQEGPVDLDISVDLEVPKNFEGDGPGGGKLDLDITCTVDRGDKTKTHIPCDPGNVYKKVMVLDKSSVRPQEKTDLKFEITEDDWDWFGDDDYGNVSISATRDELVRGKTLSCQPKNKNLPPIEIRLKGELEIPKEPKLPDWK